MRKYALHIGLIFLATMMLRRSDTEVVFLPREEAVYREIVITPWSGPTPQRVKQDRFGDSMPGEALARLGTSRFRAIASTLALSPDGKVLASSPGRLTIDLWEARTGRRIRQLHQKVGKTEINGLAFAPNGNTLVSVGTVISYWDVESGRETYRVPSEAYQYWDRVEFSADGRIFATSSRGRDGRLCLWDAKSKKLLREFGVDDRYFEDLSFSPDGTYLASSAGRDIVVFETRTGNDVRRYRKSSRVPALCFRPNGKVLAWVNFEGELKLWDVEKAADPRVIRIGRLGYGAIGFSNDGKRLVLSSKDWSPDVWDLETNELIAEGESLGLKGRARFAGEDVLVVWGKDSSIRFWDFRSNKEIPFGQGHQDFVRQVTISPDSKTLVSLGYEEVIVWEIRTGRLLYRLEPNGNSHFSCCVFSPDGKMLLTGGSEGFVRFWDLLTGREIDRWESQVGDVCRLAFSSDGSVLFSTRYDWVQAWDFTNGSTIRSFGDVSIQPRGAISMVHFPAPELELSPSSRLLYTGKWWDVSNGNVVDSRLFEEAPHPFRFSRDGRSLIGFRYDNRITHERSLADWDLRTRKVRTRYVSPDNGIEHAVLSPDEKFFAVRRDGGKLYLWDRSTGQEYFVGHDGGWSWGDIVFSPDGRYVVVVSEPTQMLVYDVSRWTKK